MYITTNSSRSNSNTTSIKMWFSCRDRNGLLSVLCFLCIVTLPQHTASLYLHYYISVCLSHKTPSKINTLSSDLTHRRGKICLLNKWVKKKLGNICIYIGLNVQRKKDFTHYWQWMWESWIVLWLKAKKATKRRHIKVLKPHCQVQTQPNHLADESFKFSKPWFLHMKKGSHNRILSKR